MSSIEQRNRILELERKVELIEARLGVVERAEAFEQSEPLLMSKRRPGRPRKDENVEAHG